MQTKTKFKLAGVLALLLVGTYMTVPYWYRSADVVIVTNKERDPQTNVLMVESVLADDDNVARKYRNEDCSMIFKWDSGDIQSKLITGKMYWIKSYGVRNRLFSWYPNIITVKRLKTTTLTED